MKDSNKSFAQLRARLPLIKPAGKRMSKIESLRMAIKYIKHLKYLLREGTRQTPSAKQIFLYKNNFCNISFYKYFLVSLTWFLPASHLTKRSRLRSFSLTPTVKPGLVCLEPDCSSSRSTRSRLTQNATTCFDLTTLRLALSLSPHYLHFVRNFRRAGRALELNISDPVQSLSV